MKYLSTYEGLFDIFRKKINNKELDIELVKDLVASDIEGMVFRGQEVGVKYLTRGYKSDRRGKPLLKNDVWYGEQIQYSSPSMGGHGELGLLLRHTYSHPSPRNEGETNTDRVDFFLTYKIYERINCDRMTEFGIGYCLFRYPGFDYYILFYPL